MQISTQESAETIYDTEELKGFARSMSELQMLLLILVILYFFVPTQPIINHESLITTMVIYAVFVMSFEPLETRPGKLGYDRLHHNRPLAYRTCREPLA